MKTVPRPRGQDRSPASASVRFTAASTHGPAPFAPIYQLVCRQVVPVDRAEVFRFFSDAANLEILTPPFLSFRILTPLPIQMRGNARIDYKLSLFGFPVKWRTRISHWEPETHFVDEQESGPYALWRHTHRFESSPAGTVIQDLVEYRLPFGPIGRLAHSLFVKRTLTRIFLFRQQTIARLFGPPAAPLA